MTSSLRKSLALLRAPANAIGFQLRSRLPVRSGLVALANETKTNLFDWLSTAARARAARREAELREHYDLTRLHMQSSVLHYAENLALLDRLEHLFAEIALPADDAVRITDLGSGAFQYATALERFVERHGAIAPRNVELLGIELDGNGVYVDGHTRAEHAAAHARLAGANAHYVVANALRVELPTQDVVTLLFPFLTRYALLQWGLPLGAFQPRRLLRAAVDVLRPGGLLVVVNQTRAELERLKCLLTDLPVRMLREASFATDLVPYAEKTADRIGSVWQRPGR